MAESSWAAHQASAAMCLAQIDTVTHTLNHLVDEVLSLKDITLYSTMGESTNEHATAAKFVLIGLFENVRQAGEAALLFHDKVQAYKESF